MRRSLLASVIIFVAVFLGALAVPCREVRAAGGVPSVVSKVYQDTDHNGTVETVTLTIPTGFVLVCTYVAGDWTYVGNGIGGTLSGGSCNAATGILTLTITGANANTTGTSSAPTIAYTNNGHISNGYGSMASIAPTAITDNAPPVATSAAYLDTNNDGRIDHVQFNTSAEASIVCGTFVGNTTFTVGTAGAIALASNAGDTCTAGTNSFTVNLGTLGAVNTTGGSTSPVVTYTQAGNGVKDGANNYLPTTAGATLTDGAKPIVVSATVNKTASRNTLTVVYSEPVTLACVSGASTAACGDLTTSGTLAGFGSLATAGNVTVPTTLNTVSGSGTNTITVSLADQTGGYIANGSTTGPSGVFTPVASAAVIDAASNQVNTSAAAPTATVTSAWTLTQPTLASVTLSDANLNGRVDTATLVFSAAVRAANITNADGLLGGAGHTGTFTTGTTTSVFALATDNLPVNTSAAAGPFTYSGATTKITDLFGNLLATAAKGTIAATDFSPTDGASPVIVSTSPAAGETGVLLSTPITINFSEPINIAGCVFSSSPDPGGFGSITDVANWSNSNETFTLNNPPAYSRNASVTITVTGCADTATAPNAMASNSFDPWTFTTLVSGSSVAHGPPVIIPPSITLSKPMGGETYAADAVVGLDWSFANGAFVKYKVYYSADNGASWNVIGGTPSLSLSWTIPDASTTLGKIKIEGYDFNNNLLASATSNGNFTVIGENEPGPPENIAAPSAAPPAADSTVLGAYSSSEALENNPDFNIDLNLPVAAAPACVPGTLFKGKSLSAVYYCGADGKRYVFVNDKVYFSWYPDFSTVKTVSDTVLASITIGGNITYRPGSRMVKIQSDPRVYVVARGGVLRWVETEANAVSLYGAGWSKTVDDIADAFFVNYTVGAPIGS